MQPQKVPFLSQHIKMFDRLQRLKSAGCVLSVGPIVALGLFLLMFGVVHELRSPVTTYGAASQHLVRLSVGSHAAASSLNCSSNGLAISNQASAAGSLRNTRLSGSGATLITLPSSSSAYSKAQKHPFCTFLRSGVDHGTSLVATTVQCVAVNVKGL